MSVGTATSSVVAVPHRRAWPAVVAGAALGSTLLGAAGLVDHRDGYVGDGVLSVVAAVAYGVLGPWIWARGSVVLGRRLAAVGVCSGVAWCSQAWSDNVVAAWVSQWSWLLPVLLVPLALTRFPDGQRLSGPRRVNQQVLGATTAAAVGLLAAAALAAPRTLLVGARGSKPGWTLVLVDAAIVCCLVWLVAVLVLVASIVPRCMSSRGQRQSQMLCLAARSASCWRPSSDWSCEADRSSRPSPRSASRWGARWRSCGTPSTTWTCWCTGWRCGSR